MASAPSPAPPLTLADVQAARQRLGDRVRRTPFTLSRALTECAGAPVYLKWENQQHTGAFKIRGAYNKILQVPAEERRHGVITASSGNHGLAVARIARQLAVPATVVVPTTAPRVKVRKIRAAGARVVLHGRTYDDAEDHCFELASARSAVYIPTDDDLAIVAGQGTIACEMLEDQPALTHVVVPAGAGGVLSGVATVVKATRPDCRVLGVQTTRVRVLHDSFRAGTLQDQPAVPSVADGLVGRTYQCLLDLVLHTVDDILLVPEAAVERAMAFVHAREGQVIEGAAAVGPAAFLEGLVPVPPDARVGVVVTGGNVDPEQFAAILRRHDLQ